MKGSLWKQTWGSIRKQVSQQTLLETYKNNIKQLQD